MFGHVNNHCPEKKEEGGKDVEGELRATQKVEEVTPKTYGLWTLVKKSRRKLNIVPAGSTQGNKETIVDGGKSQGSRFVGLMAEGEEWNEVVEEGNVVTSGSFPHEGSKGSLVRKSGRGVLKDSNWHNRIHKADVPLPKNVHVGKDRFLVVTTVVAVRQGGTC